MNVVFSQRDIINNIMAAKEQIRIVARAQSNASRNKALGCRDKALRIRIVAPLIKGAANQEVITFLSDILRLSRSSPIIEKRVSI